MVLFPFKSSSVFTDFFSLSTAPSISSSLHDPHLLMPISSDFTVSLCSQRCHGSSGYHWFTFSDITMGLDCWVLSGASRNLRIQRPLNNFWSIKPHHQSLDTLGFQTTLWCNSFQGFQWKGTGNICCLYNMMVIFWGVSDRDAVKAIKWIQGWINVIHTRDLPAHSSCP